MSSKFDRDLVFKFSLVQAKLAVVASSGDVLSDLNDLKEAKKLETDLAAIISKNHKKGLVPQNPLAFIESEINLLANWGKDVQGLIDLGDDLLSPEQLIEEGQKAGIEKMRQLQLKIEVFQSEILPKAADLRSKIPKQCFKGKLVDQRIRGIWQLKLTADDQTEEIPDFTNLIQWVGETDKAQFKVSELNEKLSAHLKLIEKLYAEANEQLSELDQVLIELECGSLSQARKFLSNEFNTNRFFDARDEKWDELTSKINDLESSLQNIKSAGNSFKIIKAINAFQLNSEWSKIKPDSELGTELNSLKKTAEHDRIKFWIFLASALLLVSLVVYYTAKLNAEMEEKFRLGRVAAANEKADAAAKAEAERIAAASAEVAAERMRAEKVIESEAEAERITAAAARVVAERLAADAKAEAERLIAEEVHAIKAEAKHQTQIVVDELNSIIASKRNENLNKLIDGVNASTITEETRERRNLHPSLKGHLIITQVDENSPYADRLLEDMIILEIDRISVTDLKEARQSLTTGRHLLLINYRSLNRFITITIK